MGQLHFKQSSRPTLCFYFFGGANVGEIYWVQTATELQMWVQRGRCGPAGINSQSKERGQAGEPSNIRLLEMDRCEGDRRRRWRHVMEGVGSSEVAHVPVVPPAGVGPAVHAVPPVSLP